MAFGETHVNEILERFTIFAVTLVVALLVWRYYKGRTFPSTDRYSTFGPRFWTGFVDSCILWPISFVTFALLCLDVPRSVAALLVIVESGTWLVYTVVMHARYGQTVGKMVTKVRVVDFHTEGSISWRQAWLREGIPTLLSLGFLGYQVYSILAGNVTLRAVANGEALASGEPSWLLSALPGLWFLAEVLTMLTNQKRRALHDFIAGTVVVRTNLEQGGAHPDGAPNDRPATDVGPSGVTEGVQSVI